MVFVSQIMKLPSLCSLFLSPAASSCLGPDVLYSTLFSNILSLCCSRNEDVKFVPDGLYMCNIS